MPECLQNNGGPQLVRLDGRLVFLWGGTPAAQAETFRNPFHSGNCYVRLQLLGVDFPPRELFALLRKEAGSPLQVMVPPEDCAVPVLLAGGFQRRRRCYEMTVTAAQLLEPAADSPPPASSRRGAARYDACCRALYAYYSETHRAVSPLTASESAFSARLPEEALYQERNGEILHFAFVEENETAYVGTRDLAAFPSFARGLVASRFRQFETLYFECDSCDPAAMALKALFAAEPSDILDTYIFP